MAGFAAIRAGAEDEAPLGGDQGTGSAQPAQSRCPY
jgi:hypothetical protein